MVTAGGWYKILWANYLSVLDNQEKNTTTKKKCHDNPMTSITVSLHHGICIVLYYTTVCFGKLLQIFLFLIFFKDPL